MLFCAEKDKRVRLFVDAIVYFRAEPGLDSVAVLEKAGGTLERWMDDDP